RRALQRRRHRHCQGCREGQDRNGRHGCLSAGPWHLAHEQTVTQLWKFGSYAVSEPWWYSLPSSAWCSGLTTANARRVLTKPPTCPLPMSPSPTSAKKKIPGVITNDQFLELVHHHSQPRHHCGADLAAVRDPQGPASGQFGANHRTHLRRHRGI